MIVFPYNSKTEVEALLNVMWGWRAQIESAYSSFGSSDETKAFLFGYQQKLNLKPGELLSMYVKETNAWRMLFFSIWQTEESISQDKVTSRVSHPVGIEFKVPMSDVDLVAFKLSIS